MFSFPPIAIKCPFNLCKTWKKGSDLTFFELNATADYFSFRPI